MMKGDIYDSVEVREDGSVHVPGIDFGSRVKEECRIDDRAFWIYRGGSSTVGTLGRPEYFPTRYMLVKYVEPRRVEVVVDIAPGRRWHDAKIQMLAAVYSGGI